MLHGYFIKTFEFIDDSYKLLFFTQELGLVSLYLRRRDDSVVQKQLLSQKKPKSALFKSQDAIPQIATLYEIEAESSSSGRYYLKSLDALSNIPPLKYQQLALVHYLYEILQCFLSEKQPAALVFEIFQNTLMQVMRNADVSLSLRRYEQALCMSKGLPWGFDADAEGELIEIDEHYYLANDGSGFVRITPSREKQLKGQDYLPVRGSIILNYHNLNQYLDELSLSDSNTNKWFKYFFSVIFAYFYPGRKLKSNSALIQSKV